MSEYLSVCLGWIMKATCCLLRCNFELMFDAINFNMPCFYCEILHNHAKGCTWYCYSHLIRWLTNDPWSETFWGFFVLLVFLLRFVSMNSSLMWPLSASGPLSKQWQWEFKPRFGRALLQGPNMVGMDQDWVMRFCYEVQEKIDSTTRNLLISYLCLEEMLSGTPY